MRASGSPERFALDCISGRPPASAARRRAARGTRSPSVSGIGPQAGRKRCARLASSSVTGPGSSACERARARGRRARRASRRRLEREEHDRRGAGRRAALELVQPPRGPLVLGVAAEAVDGVGREHGDAACRQALLQAGGVLGWRARAHRCATLPDDDALDPGQVAARRARAGSPPRAASAATAPACPAPTSSARKRTAGARATCASSARISVEPVRPREQCARGLVAEDLGSQRGALATRRHRAGWRGPRRTRRAVREQVGVQPAHLQPEPRAVRARELERRLADVAAGERQVRALVLERERDRAAAGADVQHARAVRAARARPSTSSSVSGRGTSARGSTAARARGSRGGRGCRRPARARRARRRTSS